MNKAINSDFMMGLKITSGGESIKYLSIKKVRYIPDHIRVQKNREKIINQLLDE